MKKRILSIVLCVAMLLSVVPLTLTAGATEVSPYATNKGDGAYYFLNVYDDIQEIDYMGRYNSSMKTSPRQKHEIGSPTDYLAKTVDGTGYSTSGVLFLKKFGEETFIELDYNESKAFSESINQGIHQNVITYNGDVVSTVNTGLHSSIPADNLAWAAIRVKIDAKDGDNSTSAFTLDLEPSNWGQKFPQDLSGAYAIDINGEIAKPSWSTYFVFGGEFDGWIVLPFSAWDSSSVNGKDLWTKNAAGMRVWLYGSGKSAGSSWTDKTFYLGDIVVFEDNELFDSVHATASVAPVEDGSLNILTVPDKTPDGAITEGGGQLAGGTKGYGYYWGLSGWSNSDAFFWLGSENVDGENFFVADMAKNFSNSTCSYSIDRDLSFATTGGDKRYDITFLPACYMLGAKQATAELAFSELYGEDSGVNLADYNYLAIRFKTTGGDESNYSKMQLHFGVNNAADKPIDLTGLQLIDYTTQEITTITEEGTMLGVPYDFDGWLLVPSSMFSTTLAELKRVSFALFVDDASENWDGKRIYFGDMKIVKDAGLFTKVHFCDEIGHVGGEATRKDPAVCDVCGQPYGEVDLTNHGENTGIKDVVVPTCSDDGFTGNT
ncbi:MAG: hypothetical protein IJY33_06525, partial [Oscillospiraceae bacterium]|nr:hypothetical protein [Oscillospiraceae bacterium]